jgi:soluble lytic murein transglycosylase-like protein
MKKRLIAGFLVASVLCAASAIPAQATCRGTRYCDASSKAHHVTHHAGTSHTTKPALAKSRKGAVSHASSSPRKRATAAGSTSVKPKRYAGRLKKSSSTTAALAIPAAGSASQANVISLIKAMAPGQGVPTWFALRIAHVESNYKPQMRGAAGEYGVYQLKCATAKDIGFSGNCAALLDARTNVQWGLRHLALAIGKSNGNLKLAASKHNGGLGRKRLVPTYVAKVF